MADISAWDNEPGFDANTGSFRQLDLEEWLRKHDIVKKARKQGELNKPAESQNRLDATEEQILAWINRRWRVCRDNVGRYLEDRERDLADMENDEELADLRDLAEQIRRDGEFELSRRSREGKNLLTGLWEEFTDSDKDFREFRKRSRLTRLADDSGRTPATLLFISVCFIIEVVLNASLLMEVNPFGLVGAAAQMALISAVNILIAGFAMGGLLRRKNHVDLGRKCFAWAGIAGILIGVFGFNCAVGHLRDSMQAIVNDPAADIFAVGADVWVRLQENLAGFDSFQALLLALMGILFFGVASWKWLQRDDAYPDYGRRYRELKEKRQEYSESYNRAVEMLREAGQKHISNLEDIRHKLTAQQTRWREMCIQGEKIVEQYPIQLGQYQRDLDYLIEKYREANLAAREAPAPSYFERKEIVDADIRSPLSFNPPPQQKIRDVTNRVAAAIEALQQLRSELALEFPAMEAA